MNYDDFLRNFLSGISQCLDWLKSIFVGSAGSEGSAIFTHPLIFTIMGISLFTLIIEELVGVLTSFRFGGFLFRRFGRGYGSGYRTKYETEYPKSYEVDYTVETAKPFKSRFGSKYFINYNGKFYPFYHSRYNPLYARQFNIAYKAGRVATASQIYGQKLNGGFSHFGYSDSHSSTGYNLHSVNGSFGLLGKAYGKLAKLGFKYGKQALNEDNSVDNTELALKEAWEREQERQYNADADWESLQSTEPPSPKPNIDIIADDDE